MQIRKTYRAFITIVLLAAAMTVIAMAGKVSAAEVTAIVKEGDTYYLTLKETGAKVTGRKGIAEFPVGSGDYYFFRDSDGAIYVNALITQSGKTYYAQADGKLASGFVKIKNASYYFIPATHAMATGWKRISGQQYLFSAKGVQQFGFVKSGKYTYYLNPKKNGAKTIGLKRISGKYYYFNARGRMQKGIVDVDGKSYFFNDNGVRKSGVISYKGSRYYFKPEMKKGWFTINNRKFYFGNDGKAVTGWLDKNGKKYYFNSYGVMQKGWLNADGKRYYLDPSTGVLNTKTELTIDGKKYEFNKDGSLKVLENLTPTKIRVNQSTCVVTIYSGSTPIKAMLCSVGVGGATPNGTFSLGVKRHWHELNGGVYGQYTSAITSSILFHSVYYYRYRDNNSLSTEQYNKLGSPASAGCVRLNCADAYYIYTRCAVGTPVEIGYFGAGGDPLGKPAALRINTSYDPTDPNPND